MDCDNDFVGTCDGDSDGESEVSALLRLPTVDCKCSIGLGTVEAKGGLVTFDVENTDGEADGERCMHCSF